MTTLLRRLRSERGFGLIELVIALGILNVGLLALSIAFISGATTLKRGAEVATGTALAERQLELYRGLRYTSIGLAPSLVTSASSDSRYVAAAPSTGTADTSSCTDVARPECQPIQSVTGPDGHTYRIDSYVVRVPYSATREYKLVRVTVRDGDDLERRLVTHESTFDQSTGL